MSTTVELYRGDRQPSGVRRGHQSHQREPLHCRERPGVRDDRCVRKLAGVIEFALDPRNPQNLRVVDLGRAAQREDGRVHFAADLVVLRPADPASGNGVLLFEVVNRGRIGLLTRFNSAPGAVDPAAPADFGNGFLVREGYTLVMVGWEFDIPPATIRLNAPALTDLTESNRVPFILDRKADEPSLDDAPMYEPVDPADPASTLTVRDHYWDAPSPIERTRWRFVTGNTGASRVALNGGFEPGRIYELTFRAHGARVVGAGLAAIRDAVSGFRYRSDLPVQGKAAYALGPAEAGHYVHRTLRPR